MIGFDPIVRILLSDMTGSGHQLIEHPRVGEGTVGGDLDRLRLALEGADENRRVAARSRLSETSTSMTCPNWSIARYRCRRGRAVTEIPEIEYLGRTFGEA